MIEHYDLLYFLPPTFGEDQVKNIEEKIKQNITKADGVIKKEITLGKKKLAYKIQQHKYGIYMNVYFDLESRKLPEIDNFLRLENDVVRHLIVKGEPREDLAYNITPLGADRPEETAVPEKAAFTARPVAPTTPTSAPAETQRMDQPPTPPAPGKITTEATTTVTEKPAVEEKKTVEKKEEKNRDEGKVSLEELDEKLDKILSDDIIK